MSKLTDKIKPVKNKLGSFLIIFLIELLLLIAAVVYIFVPKKIYSYDIPEFNAQYNVRIDNQSFGRYIYKVEYNIQDDGIVVSAEAVKDGFFNGHVNTEGQLLRSAYNEYEFEYWVTGIKNDVNITIADMSQGLSSAVTKVTVRETNFAAYVLLIIVLLIIGITYYVYCAVSGRLGRESVKTTGILAAICAVAALPLFTPYMQLGADAVFHLNRIEGIKEALLGGQFPVRVDGVYLNGYGYAVSTFYGSLFFYIPVAARLIGFSLQFSFKIFIMFLNIIMVANSYFFFKKITKERKWGIIGCFCFTLFTYKFINMYTRAAVSEASSLAVLPLLANIFYDVFTREHDREYKHLWIKLTLAFGLVLENHIISTEIFGVTMIFICIAYFKKTFNKDTFLVLLKFVICTALLNAFFLVPFIKTITTMEFKVNTWELVSTQMQDTGYKLLDWLHIQKPQYDAAIWYQQVIDIVPGLSAVLMFLCSIAAIVSGVFKSSYKKIFKLFFVESIVLFVITSIYFPWDAILGFAVDHMGRLGLTLVNMFVNIQFLFRLTVLVDLFFTGLFVISLKYLTGKAAESGKGRNVWIVRGMLAIVMCVTLVQTLLLESSVMATQYNSKYEKFFISELDEYYCKNIGNEEYIPKTDVEGWSWSGAYDDRTVRVEGGTSYNLKKKGTHLTFTVTTEPDVTAWIDIPLIYYYGYHAYNVDTGEEISIFQNGGGKISFIMPGDTTWNVEVVYRDEVNWKRADMISIITLLGMAAISLWDAYRKRRNA